MVRSADTSGSGRRGGGGTFGSSGSPSSAVGPIAASDPDLAAALRAAAGAGYAPAAADSVWLGGGGTAQLRRQPRTVTFTDQTRTVDDMYGDLYDPTQFAAIKQKLVAAGLVDASASFTQVASAWSQVLKEASLLWSAGKKISPWDVINKWGSGGVGAGSSGGPTKSTQRTVNLTDQTSAKGLLRTAMTSLLGRAPTDDEVKQFHAALNAKERANPDVSVTTTSGAGTSTFSQSTTSSGGLDREVVAADTARADPNFAEHQVATTYMNALMQMLGG